MAKVKIVSDRLAKVKCREWLEKVGFTDIKPEQIDDEIRSKLTQIYDAIY